MHSTRGHNLPSFAPKIPGTDLRASNVPTAIIYRPARNVMQSGRRPRCWDLEFEPTAAAEIEPLLGWTTSRDPYRPIRLSFPDRKSAVDFALRQDWDFIARDTDQLRLRRAHKQSHRASGQCDSRCPSARLNLPTNPPEADYTDHALPYS